MRIKYKCQVYNSEGSRFTFLEKGTEIRVVFVDKKVVKIEWDREGDSKYKTGFGYISHRQFIICVDKEEDKAKEVKKKQPMQGLFKFWKLWTN